jgi:hypothetical protein
MKTWTIEVSCLRESDLTFSEEYLALCIQGRDQLVDILAYLKDLPNRRKILDTMQHRLSHHRGADARSIMYAERFPAAFIVDTDFNDPYFETADYNYVAGAQQLVSDIAQLVKEVGGKVSIEVDDKGFWMSKKRTGYEFPYEFSDVRTESISWILTIKK